MCACCSLVWSPSVCPFSKAWALASSLEQSPKLGPHYFRLTAPLHCWSGEGPHSADEKQTIASYDQSLRTSLGVQSSSRSEPAWPLCLGSPSDYKTPYELKILFLSEASRRRQRKKRENKPIFTFYIFDLQDHPTEAGASMKPHW